MRHIICVHCACSTSTCLSKQTNLAVLHQTPVSWHRSTESTKNITTYRQHQGPPRLNNNNNNARTRLADPSKTQAGSSSLRLTGIPFSPFHGCTRPNVRGTHLLPARQSHNGWQEGHRERQEGSRKCSQSGCSCSEERSQGRTTRSGR